MRVAHIVEAWAGGIATYVSDLIRYQVKCGHNVTLIADGAQLALDKRDIAVSVIEYNSGRSPKGIYKSCKQVMAILEKNSFDVIHAHSTFPGIYTRTLGVAHPHIIYTPHAWSFIKRDIGILKAMLYKFVERRLSNKSRKIICMSFEEIKEGIKAGIAPEKMGLLYTGIPDQACMSDTHFAKVLNDNNVINVGFFGRLDYQKGYDNLIEASKLLSDRVNIHIYGGAIRGNAAIEPGNISHNRVTHHGWIPQSELSEALNTVDVVVIPSRWEGFALTPLEAMRAGRGVIVSNMSSLPEVVINGFNGIVLKDISPKSIADVLNSIDKSDCIKFSKNARLVYEQTFGQELFMSRMESLYNE